ncbi:MAG: 50S ribosomal protein L17 [Dehalococcoidia bacterium]
MRHRLHRRKLGRPTAHRLLMLRNLVTDLLRNEQVITTEAKAKEARSMAEKVITWGKGGTLHGRRQVLRLIWQKAVVRKLFDELGPRYADRPGGYTRIVKLAPRRGDGAPMVQIELV